MVPGELCLRGAKPPDGALDGQRDHDGRTHEARVEGDGPQVLRAEATPGGFHCAVDQDANQQKLDSRDDPLHNQQEHPCGGMGPSCLPDKAEGRRNVGDLLTQLVCPRSQRSQHSVSQRVGVGQFGLDTIL